MNITEFMSFDLKWFTTLPGLLITGGVIVLLIALIIFIISNKKTDKQIKDEVTQQPVDSQDMVQPVNTGLPIEPQVMEQPVNTVVPVETQVVEPQMQINEMAATINVPIVPEVTNEPVNSGASSEPIDVTYNSNGSVNILGNPQTNGVMPPVSTAVEIPTFFEQNVPANANTMNINNTAVTSSPVDFSINNEPVVPAVNNVAVETPVVTEPVMPQVDNQISTPVVPMAQPEVPMAPVVEQQAPQPTIYGGVSPINTVNTSPVAETTKPVIYGGANPLENTTTIPVMNNHGAYNASGNNSYVEPAPVVQNVVSPEAKVTQPVIEQPQVVVTPEINQIPVEPVVVPQMPLTGAEMFGTNDNVYNSGSNNSSNEIETLEF